MSRIGNFTTFYMEDDDSLPIQQLNPVYLIQ